jgi:hypothetical protein
MYCVNYVFGFSTGKVWVWIRKLNTRIKLKGNQYTTKCIVLSDNNDASVSGHDLRQTPEVMTQYRKVYIQVHRKINCFTYILLIVLIVLYIK